MPDPHSRSFFGYLVLGAILFAALFGLLFHDKDGSIGYSAEAATASSTGIVGNATPIVSGFTVNNGTSVTPIANSTTTVTVNFTVTDDNGCGSVFYTGNVTTTFFRSSTVATCATSTPSQNLLNCYVVATTTNNCSGANSTTTSANVTTTFQVWYFADATDASSSYASDTWKAYAIAQDSSSTTGASTSATGIEVNTMIALALGSSSLDYGVVQPNTNTGGVNRISGVANAGNASATLQINGTAMVSGPNTMPTSSIHYATSTFTYGGGEQQLQAAATVVSGWLANPVPVRSSWQTGAAFPNPIEFAASANYLNYLYVLGGDNGVLPTSTVWKGTISPTGTITSWTAQPALPATLRLHSASVSSYVPNAPFIALTGGYVDGVGAPTSTSLYSFISPTGTLLGWATTTSAAAPIFEHKFRLTPDYAWGYVTGGLDASGVATSSVSYLHNGSSSFALTTSLPARLRSHGSFIFGNNLYTIGGADSSSITTATVQYAPINATGSLGAWTPTTPLPVALCCGGVLMNSGIVYVVGGYSTTGGTSSLVYYAPVLPTGGVGPWSTSSALNALSDIQATITGGGYLYNIGGGTAAGPPTSTVRYIGLPSKDLYFGLGVPGGTPQGNYSSTLTYTAVYSP